MLRLSLGVWWLLARQRLRLMGVVLCLAAIDVDTRELLMGFMAEESTLKPSWVLEACMNKLVILVDGGPWYPEALKALLEWIHETFGEPY
jgi:transposase-like protein